MTDTPERPTPYALQAEDIGKRFGDRQAVASLCLSVREGEIVGFLGPNGAGKSTAIAMLSGALPPDSGTVTVCGHDLWAAPARAKPLIGVVPQEIALYPSLSARQNLEFFSEVYRVPRHERASRIAWALEVVALADRAADRVTGFSGGMQRRVNIAAALLHRPRLLFLDEPTVGVDAQSRRQIFETVRALRTELGMSVVYTSHYMPEVEELCDRVVIVDQGRVLAEGSQEELLAPLGGSVLYWSPSGSELAALAGGIDTLADALRGAGEVSVTTGPGGTPVLRVRAGAPDRLLRDLPRTAARHGLSLAGVRLERPGLESLFLDLTGRDIREEH
ncbi:ABC transporter ATP-binding protein [Streptomyces sp. Pv4-95]|uniref:ABC transporter ATP-binding protein n=1 Tax=Streptomyces sp. Pv4-95 TaxID=3049543 RepID=UPI0038913CD1